VETGNTGPIFQQSAKSFWKYLLDEALRSRRAQAVMEENVQKEIDTLEEIRESDRFDSKVKVSLLKSANLPADPAIPCARSVRRIGDNAGTSEARPPPSNGYRQSPRPTSQIRTDIAPSIIANPLPYFPPNVRAECE
jgi:hypothetical protein